MNSCSADSPAHPTLKSGYDLAETGRMGTDYVGDVLEGLENMHHFGEDHLVIETDA